MESSDQLKVGAIGFLCEWITGWGQEKAGGKWRRLRYRWTGFGTRTSCSWRSSTLPSSLSATTTNTTPMPSPPATSPGSVRPVSSLSSIWFLRNPTSLRLWFLHSCLPCGPFSCRWKLRFSFLISVTRVYLPSFGFLILLASVFRYFLEGPCRDFLIVRVQTIFFSHFFIFIECGDFLIFFSCLYRVNSSCIDDRSPFLCHLSLSWFWQSSWCVWAVKFVCLFHLYLCGCCCYVPVDSTGSSLMFNVLFVGPDVI